MLEPPTLPDKTMRTRLRLPVLGRLAAALLAILVGVGCNGRNDGGSTTTGSGTGTTATVSPVPFKSGYLRGPAKDRVIVFVNGVFGDSRSTWTNENGAYWPQLVADDPEYADSDIYVHSFESPKLSQAQEILELAGRMKNYFDAENLVTSHKQLVFVCHSMGGLIVRAYLLSARIPSEKIAFLSFFGTPTAGANIADFAAAISPSPQLDNMRPLDDDTYVKTLREQWLRSSDDPALDYPRKVSSFCSYEKKTIWNITVVKEVSATYLCNRGTNGILEDHLSIVKPADRRGEAYVALLAAYKSHFGPAAMEVRNAVAEVRPAELLATRVFRVAELPTAKIALRQEKATAQPLTVSCGQISEGELAVTANLAAGESVSEVHPDIVNGSNLASATAVVVRFDGKTALIRYRIQGGPCPGDGHGDVAVNFVTNNPRTFPVEATQFVRRDALRFPVGRVIDMPVAAPTATPRFARPIRRGTDILVRTPAR